MGNFLVRYASRVVIYDRRAVIRLATAQRNFKAKEEGICQLKTYFYIKMIAIVSALKL